MTTDQPRDAKADLEVCERVVGVISIDDMAKGVPYWYARATQLEQELKEAESEYEADLDHAVAQSCELRLELESLRTQLAARDKRIEELEHDTRAKS